MISKRARAARKTFRDKYGVLTGQIIREERKTRSVTLCQSEEIARKLCVGRGTVAAVLANLTRGTYAPYATVSPRTFAVKGTCRF